MPMVVYTLDCKFDMTETSIVVCDQLKCMHVNFLMRFFFFFPPPAESVFVASLSEKHIIDLVWPYHGQSATMYDR